MSGWWKRSVLLAAAISLLAACADDPKPVNRMQTKRVSPEAVPAPTVPAGTFDKARSQSYLAQARSAEAASNLADARTFAQYAVDSWPGDTDAWSELQTICHAQKDADCADRAAFFHDKVEYANPLPARVGVLGFQSIAEEEASAPAKKGKGKTSDSGDYDQATIDTARRLWAFYNTQDPALQRKDVPETPPGWTENYPYVTMIGVGGVAAGVIAGVKSIANK